MALLQVLEAIRPSCEPDGKLLLLGTAEGVRPVSVLSRKLYTEAIAHNARTKYATDTEFGRFLAERGCEHKSNGKAWGWIFPPLDEARRAWELRMGGNVEWLGLGIKEWNEK